MRLRPYRAKDFSYIQSWICEKRIHALWCANRLPWPVAEEVFESMLEDNEREWGGCGYTLTEDCGLPVGFLVYSVNDGENSGFVSYIVVDSSLRGKGYGTQMLKLLLEYAFLITNVDLVRLNVFDVNERAKRCYEKAGFEEESFTEDALLYEGEVWGRYLMVAKRKDRCVFKDFYRFAASDGDLGREGSEQQGNAPLS